MLTVPGMPLGGGPILEVRMHRLVALVLAVGALVAPVNLSTAAAVDGPPPTSGPVLYQPVDSQFEELGYNVYASLLSTDGSQLQVPQKWSSLYGYRGPSAYDIAKFSPDGGSVVTPVCAPSADCTGSDEVWTLEITSAVNDQPTQVGALPVYPSDLAWSPDGTQIAALLLVPTSDFLQPDYRIVRIAVGSGVMTTVLADSSDAGTNSTFDIVDAGISWGPDGRIAFIGTKSVNGDLGVEDIFTVPSTGGTPTRYNGKFPDDDVYHDFGDTYCEGTLLVGYYAPAWSPDGSSIAARMILNDGRATCDDQGTNYNCDVRSQLVEVTPGATTPTVLVNLPEDTYEFDPENPDRCLQAFTSYRSWEPEPVWSLDGVHLMYGFGPANSYTANDGVSVGIVDTSTLVVTTPVTMADKLTNPDEAYYGHFYKDWQPCPTGTCVLWDEPEHGADVRISVRATPTPARSELPEPVTFTVDEQGARAGDRRGVRGAHADRQHDPGLGEAQGRSRRVELRLQQPGGAEVLRPGSRRRGVGASRAGHDWHEGH